MHIDLENIFQISLQKMYIVAVLQPTQSPAATPSLKSTGVMSGDDEERWTRGQEERSTDGTVQTDN